jgi:hypothetical protein
MVADSQPRPYIDEHTSGHVWFPQHGIEIWITGEVIDGPDRTLREEGAAYNDTMERFTVRVRDPFGRRDRPFDVVFGAFTGNSELSYPPLWLDRLRIGSLVQVQLFITDSEDLADLADLHGAYGHEFFAHTLRLFSDESGQFPAGEGPASTAPQSPLRQMVFDLNGRMSWEGTGGAAQQSAPAPDQDTPDGHCWRCGAALEADERADGESLCAYCAAVWDKMRDD